MIVSLALLGYAVAGTLLSLRPKTLERDLSETLSHGSLLYIVSLILSYVLVNRIPFDPTQIVWDIRQMAYLFLFYVLLSVPFFFVGITAAVALVRLSDKGRVYGSTMLGSALGGVFALILSSEGVSYAIIVSALLGYGGVAAFSWRRRSGTFIVAGLILLFLAASFGSPLLELRLSPYKTLNRVLSYPGAGLVATRWTPTARVDVVSSGGVRYAPGMSLRFQGEIPLQLGVTLDGDNLGAITRNKNLEFLDFLPSSLPYRLKDNPRVLVLRSVGGFDALSALYHESSDVTVVEENRGLVELVDGFRDYSGDLYGGDNVDVVFEDERAFLKENERGFDVVVLTQVESIMSSSVGLFAESENYLFTVEAFEDIIGVLEDDGILSLTRWIHYPPRESLRMVSLIVGALEEEGLDPTTRIVFIRSPTTYTILVKKGGFTQREMAEVREFSESLGFDIVYVPGVDDAEVNRFNVFPEPAYYLGVRELVNPRRRQVFTENYLFDLSPASDDKPFFGNFFRWAKIAELYHSVGEKWQPFVEGGFVSAVVLLQALILSMFLITLPLVSRRGFSVSSPACMTLPYFLFIGLGFMFVEVTLIQKFTLVAGNPLLGFALVLFSLLASSGLGSITSDRMNEGKAGSAALALAAAIFVYTLLITRITDILLQQPPPLRIVASAASIAPLGFLMGLPFPLALRLIKNKEVIPWAWCVNGCASVCGAVLAVVLAESFGFRCVLFFGSFAYLLCFFIAFSGLRR